MPSLAHPHVPANTPDMSNYLRHWELEFSPYANAPVTYPAPAHDEALARIDYLCAQRRPLGALVGAPGMGKSTVLASAKEQLRRAGAAVALVDAYAVTPRELLWQVACGLEVEPAIDDSPSRLWQRLGDFASQLTWQAKTAAVLVDDAGIAGPDVCQQLVRLARFQVHGQAPWTIVAAATPQQASRWPDALLELIDLPIELAAWDELTTIDYLQHALVAAGRIQPVFTEDALHRIHVLAQGVPRKVARIADFALLAGAGAEVSIVDSAIVDAAGRETRWPPTPTVTT